MALIRATSSGGGSGDNAIYHDNFSHTAGAIINRNIQGKAHAIYISDNGSLMYSNVDPSTGEISDTSLFVCNLGTNTWSTNTNVYFIRTNGNVKTNATIKNTNANMCMLYTVE